MTSGSAALPAARTPINWRDRILERLGGSVPQHDLHEWRVSGLAPEQVRRIDRFLPANPVPAAVLVPLVERPEGLSVLLTQRATHLKNHAGQISFPGGRMEATDATVVETALRESEEEIGLRRELVSVVGFLPDHAIISGYRVTPVVGFVRSDFSLALDATEVQAIFEVPLAYVFDPANHVPRRRSFGDLEIELIDIPFGTRNIWGATAGMLLTFYRMMVLEGGR